MTETENVHPHEINKFGSLAERWWDLQGEFKTLHDINPLRIQFITGFLAIPKKKIVDVGCGGGILSDRDDHAAALRRTGFWGQAAAGCLILALDTGRILIPHRSEHCQQPNTWGTWGGAIDRGESPEVAVLRELSEEAGFEAPVDTIPLFVFRHESGFRYHNFLITAAREFEPRINWETEAFA